MLDLARALNSSPYLSETKEILEKIMRKFLIALGLLLFAGQASAYYAWGAGELQCKRFVSSKSEYQHGRDRQTHPEQLNWIKGFITGINWSRDSNIARDLTIETVDNWIDDYCRKNLGVPIARAAEALVIHLEGESGNTD